MIAMLTRAGRLLLAHWPALLAWYLAGILLRYAVIQFAGFVGAYSAIAGLAIMPLAILARLIPFVAMFLVLRDGMLALQSLSPLPEARADRRRQFTEAVLGGILPFFAFYAAWGYLREDMSAYYTRVLEVNSGFLFSDEQIGDGAVGELQLGPLTIAIIVIAFALRWLLKRYRDRLPKWFAIVSVYLEAVWVFLSVMLVSQVLDAIGAWVDTRQGIVWLTGLREWFGEQLVAVAWIWDGIEWLIGQIGGIILLPLAWLTIAGVIYGQAIEPEAVRLRVQHEAVTRIRVRYRSLPQRLRSRLGDLWNEFASRFRPIGRALVLMWRAGPVLIGGYILMATVVAWLAGAGQWALTRLIGPEETAGFWMLNSPAIFLIVPVLIEPIRVSVVAAAYDSVLARLRPGSVPGAGPAQGTAVSQGPAQGSTTIRANSGSAEADSTSTANGPDASSGTR